MPRRSSGRLPARCSPRHHGRRSGSSGARGPRGARRGTWRGRQSGGRRAESPAARRLAGEAVRRARAAPFRREVSGKLDLPGLGFTLPGRADRIDRDPSGAYAIYDYKSGSLPSDRQLRAFHLQLPLEAAMIGAGGFPDVPPGPVFHLELIGLGGTGDSRTIAADGFETVLARLGDLLGHYLSPKAASAPGSGRSASSSRAITTTSPAGAS